MGELISGKRLVLLELNEVNFDVTREYLNLYPGKFKWLEKLCKEHSIRTSAEKKYEQLEPWIQWVSIHTGRTYDEHKIFRLGDIVGSQSPQFFEQLENAGIRVGNISAMNAENRLKNPAYFIPDPWTNTHSDGSWWSESLGKAVSQAVNDNAQSRITLKSAFSLLLGLARFAQLRHYGRYLNLALSSRGAPWRKALVLDLLLHDLHLNMFNRTRPEFSALFLNAGAHIQHHYFFNAAPIKNQLQRHNPEWYAPADVDPFGEMLEVYDLIIGEYLERDDIELIVATGLSQCPYDRVKFYYRLKDHAVFLNQLGVQFESVAPRMTRDFLIKFTSSEAALEAEEILKKIMVENDSEPLFGEIDNRGDNLFVTLTYPNEITKDTRFKFNGRSEALLPQVAFVAIKNGMHQEEGFAFFTSGVAAAAPAELSHVKALHGTVLQYFGQA